MQAKNIFRIGIEIPHQTWKHFLLFITLVTAHNFF